MDLSGCVCVVEWWVGLWNPQCKRGLKVVIVSIFFKSYLLTLWSVCHSVTTYEWWLMSMGRQHLLLWVIMSVIWSFCTTQRSIQVFPDGITSFQPRLEYIYCRFSSGDLPRSKKPLFSSNPDPIREPWPHSFTLPDLICLTLSVRYVWFSSPQYTIAAYYA
jgi:hypothetical protein